MALQMTTGRPLPFFLSDPLFTLSLHSILSSLVRILDRSRKDILIINPFALTFPFRITQDRFDPGIPVRVEEERDRDALGGGFVHDFVLG